MAKCDLRLDGAIPLPSEVKTSQRLLDKLLHRARPPRAWMGDFAQGDREKALLEKWPEAKERGS